MNVIWQIVSHPIGITFTVLQIVFLIFKLAGIIGWHWLFIFAPGILLIAFVLYILFSVVV